jgi:hypothetical protein
MNAQIINLAERREAVRLRNDPFALSLVWPGIFVGCAAFWFCVGVSVARVWPLVALGTPPAHG